MIKVIQSLKLKKKLEKFVRSKLANIAIIPARKGSKRIKNKNVTKICGVKLIDYTIRFAESCKDIKKVVVITNIKELLKRKKTKKTIYLSRPEFVSRDHSATASTIINIINNHQKLFENSNLVILQPTSPLRNSKDISSALYSFKKNKFDSLFSGYVEKSFVWKTVNKKILPVNYNPLKRPRSQKYNGSIIENGAIYIAKTKFFLQFKCRLFKKIGCYLMSKHRSLEIDVKKDLEIVKAHIKYQI